MKITDLPFLDRICRTIEIRMITVAYGIICMRE